MRRRWVPALVASSLALLGACGDDEGDDGGGAAADAGSTTTSTTASDAGGGGGGAPGGDEATSIAAGGGSPSGDGGDGGEDGDGGSGGAVGDLCAALEGVDLEALLAEPVEAPVAERDAVGEICRVESAGETRSGISLVVIPTEGADNYENQRELFGVDSEVAGLGDAAFHTGPYLFVLDGDRLVYLQVVRDAANGGVEDAELEAAMRTVLDALG